MIGASFGQVVNFGNVSEAAYKVTHRTYNMNIRDAECNGQDFIYVTSDGFSDQTKSKDGQNRKGKFNSEGLYCVDLI